MLVSAYPLTWHHTSAVLQQKFHRTCTETLMFLLGVKQQLMVVQSAVESRVLKTTGGHSEWKTSEGAVEFLRDRHLLRWPLNSMPLLNSKPHCCDNNSLPLDPVLNWSKPFYILLLHVVNTDAHINIILYMPRSHMWISDQNLNTSPICVFYSTFPIMPLAIHHNVNRGLAL